MNGTASEHEDGSRSKRWLRAAAPLASLLLVVWVVAFGYVWIGTWDLGPDSYESAADWWTEFALPRAAGSLVLGVPLGIVLGLAVRRMISRRQGVSIPA